jgi:hypothetical protein
MRWSIRNLLASLALTAQLGVPSIFGMGTAAAAAPPRDGISGTWQVSQICLSICVSPPGVLKIVRPLHTNVFITSDPTPQILYRIGMQVLVHGPKGSSLLTIRTPGGMMSGSGVGVDGSTFITTWRCIAPPGAPVPGQSATSIHATHATMIRPEEAPKAITVC